MKSTSKANPKSVKASALDAIRGQMILKTVGIQSTLMFSDDRTLLFQTVTPFLDVAEKLSVYYGQAPRNISDRKLAIKRVYWRLSQFNGGTLIVEQVVKNRCTITFRKG